TGLLCPAPPRKPSPFSANRAGTAPGEFRMRLTCCDGFLVCSFFLLPQLVFIPVARPVPADADAPFPKRGRPVGVHCRARPGPRQWFPGSKGERASGPSEEAEGLPKVLPLSRCPAPRSCHLGWRLRLQSRIGGTTRRAACPS